MAAVPDNTVESTRPWARTSSTSASDDPQLGGEENVKLRQAISLAIDRDEINDEGLRGHPHRLHRRHAARHPRASSEASATTASSTSTEAKKLFEEWKADGGTLTGPINDRLQRGWQPRRRRRHHPGQPEGQPRHRRPSSAASPRTTSRSSPRRVAATLPVRLVRRLPDVRQLHGRPVRRRPRSVATTSVASTTRSSRTLIAEAQAETDDAKRGELYNQAEELPPQRRRPRADPAQLVHRRPGVPRQGRQLRPAAAGIMLWERVGVEQLSRPPRSDRGTGRARLRPPRAVRPSASSRSELPRR